jgi:hypothetical protein
MFEGETQKRIRMAQATNLAIQVAPKFEDEEMYEFEVKKWSRLFFTWLGDLFQEISVEEVKNKETRKAEIGELQFEANDHLQPNLEDLPEGISDFGQ